jgi:hypothetical protein
MQIDWVLFHRLASQTILLGLIVIVNICQGCIKSDKALHTIEHGVSHREDLISLEKGFLAYENNDARNAAEIFQTLYDNTGSMEIRQHALYGLSISRLWSAKTAEEFKDARNLWQEWRQIRNKNTECEDPAYLEPFLMCKYPYSKTKEKDVKITDSTSCSGKVSNHKFEQVKEQTQSLETDLERLKKKFDMLKAEKDALIRIQSKKEATIQTLKEKIKALEDIDQKIQEKKNKTEISSPE